MLAKNALVVDDSRTARMVLKSQLSQFDVTVESAPDGGQALDLLRDHAHAPDVIFLDHVMPGLDGFQVLARLKKDQSTKNIPVVMYTSQAAPQYIKEAKSLGAIAVIPKNVSDEELAEALDKAELYRLTAANDDFAVADDGNIAPGEPLRAANIPETAVSTDAVSPGQAPQPQPVYVQPLEGVRSEGAPQSEVASMAAQAANSNFSHEKPAKAHVSNALIMILLALLTFSQGYAVMRDNQQAQTISSLQQQLHQQSLLNQQSQMLPDLRNQIASQQYQLDEIMLQQMSMLFTLLKEKPSVVEPLSVQPIEGVLDATPTQ